ncbi:hypothetical protein [Nodularia spumigena]|uniref:Uncharacterized protein n=1 Tax=Nodularia spumigena UHCC 0060 TaxID=3110300 RepID=A0ABU5UUA5_NODSP|nr:hypothetical protein [Nodularia spumigena]MEA5526948.1 hypothetical protein [Nodularia spumigena UHCC 0143]MEA5609836.1 hypothetical protein [Nodularia spumigena UHCC 0060]MEA5615580.1 hypothetical protein [Nodularia spumigena UHCC 0040]
MKTRLMSGVQVKVTAHIHGRIYPLIQEAIDKGLIAECQPTENNSYLLRKTNELTASEYQPITTGVILLHLLKKV